MIIMLYLIDHILINLIHNNNHNHNHGGCRSDTGQGAVAEEGAGGELEDGGGGWKNIFKRVRDL